MVTSLPVSSVLTPIKNPPNSEIGSTPWPNGGVITARAVASCPKPLELILILALV
mgnify:CR=1 FL=1